jgi:hypothetical protein
MADLPRYALILVLSISCAVLPPRADCQTKASPKTPTSCVSGRVTIHGKGAAGITVGISGQDFFMQPAATHKATTDQDGNYRITSIPAGNYQVSPIAPVYVQLDNISPRGRGATLLLAEGEDVQGIDFSLVRGGVITGKVTDAEGRPVIEEHITILPEDQAKFRGRSFSATVGVGFQTDDRGIYRIYGIPEGRYRVSAGQADDDPYQNSNPRSGRVAYRRTFYPDATQPDEAKVVEVTEGSENTNIDITLGRTLPGFAASGKVVDSETGQPVMGLRFALRRIITDGNSVMSSMTASNSQGEFRLENVTAGTYALLLIPQMGSDLTAEPVPLEIIDQDVTGLAVKTSKGLSISGTVVVDGANDKSVLAKLLQLRLSVYVRGDNANPGFGRDTSLNADGSFRIGGLSPGTANFYLSTPGRGEPAMFNILRTEKDGIAQPRGVDVKPGENITGIRVILSYGTGSVHGEVKFENGPLPQGGRVLVWIKKLGDTDYKVSPNSLDARGHFLIQSVPAGSYELTVNANIPGRREPVSVKQPISVSEGTATDVEVTLDLKANPQP